MANRDREWLVHWHETPLSPLYQHDICVAQFLQRPLVRCLSSSVRRRRGQIQPIDIVHRVEIVSGGKRPDGRWDCTWSSTAESGPRGWEDGDDERVPRVFRGTMALDIRYSLPSLPEQVSREHPRIVAARVDTTSGEAHRRRVLQCPTPSPTGQMLHWLLSRTHRKESLCRKSHWLWTKIKPGWPGLITLQSLNN